MQAAMLAMPGQAAPARRIANLLDIPCTEIDAHRFPDGESLVRVEGAASTSLLYCSLDRPNQKLIELLFAASAARNHGAVRLVLIAPYLCYMRQDTAFRPGEAVSQKIIGDLLGRTFERIVTVDAHLHRTTDIKAILTPATAENLSAAELFVRALHQMHPASAPVLIGPDEESRQWLERIALPLRADFLIGRKQRSGDNTVAIEVPGIERVRGKSVVIVDDIVSSGGTLGVCVAALKRAGARTVDALVTHCLCTDDNMRQLGMSGLDRLRSTDSVLHETNQFELAGLLAQALRNEVPA